MKYLKILGLAAVAATALMAFAGAGTASAETTLCTTTPVGTPELPETTCPEAEMLGPGRGTEMESISAESTAGAEEITKPTLTGSPFGTIKCNSTVSGKIETTTTPEGKVEAANLGWSGCEGGTATTATGGTIQIHWDAEHNGKVTFKGFVVKVVQAGIPCFYSTGEGIEGTLTGGEPAIIHITTTVPVIHTEVHNSSAFCPVNAVWHATYKVTSPKRLYVGHM